jgi:uncharacterized protein YjaG (DUF416 family)
MTYQEFTAKFKLRATKTSYEKQLQLALSVCKKLFFDYQLFSDKNNWGDSDMLLDAIKIIENATLASFDEGLISKMIDSITTITPDTEDFGDVSYALNACVSVCESLAFLIDKDAEHIYTIGTMLTDTIDFKIQEDSDLTQEQIDRDPIMIETRNYLLELTK